MVGVREGFLDITIATMKNGGKKASIASQLPDISPVDMMHHSQSQREKMRSQMSMVSSPAPFDEFMKRQSVLSHQMSLTANDNTLLFNSPGTINHVQPKLVPNFDRQGERLTIFSQPSRAKTIIGHYEGRHQVNDKRFESPSPLMQLDS